ncbi:hypothetical protein [Streptomyces sp. ISL-86]|uniref:hypothetical protein n=1 Tax=Streptomyces sp. ISL-86 TaxID=2819187 RepID=UPI001BE855D7|nr:hypothetical protein [Streptomyces sp. ISL-86]MBT2457585.1 hypothetical protein [Streptomyces sp. ISL-86]
MAVLFVHVHVLAHRPKSPAPSSEGETTSVETVTSWHLRGLTESAPEGSFHSARDLF